MEAEILARVQFAFTVMFHYLYPPLSIGLGVVLVIMESLWLKTGNPKFHNMARFWTRIFALTFAIGVATGVVMEFEFGTNWATYSRFVGDIFGSALAVEGIFARRLSFSEGSLVVNVVPEPSTSALLALAAAGFGAHVLRRRRKQGTADRLSPRHGERGDSTDLFRDCWTGCLLFTRP